MVSNCKQKAKQKSEHIKSVPCLQLVSIPCILEKDHHLQIEPCNQYMFCCDIFRNLQNSYLCKPRKSCNISVIIVIDNAVIIGITILNITVCNMWLYIFNYKEQKVMTITPLIFQTLIDPSLDAVTTPAESHVKLNHVTALYTHPQCKQHY